MDGAKEVKKKQVWTLNFLIGIICILLHWWKKLTLRTQIGPACNIILNPNITHLVIHAHDVTVPSNFTVVFEDTWRGKCLAYRAKSSTRLFEYVSTTPFKFISEIC